MRSRSLTFVFTMVLSFSVALAVSAQKKTDREVDGLKGPVLAVRIEIANLDKHGKPDKEGRWLSRLTGYDAKGNKTEDETFYCFGKCSYGKYTYKHDSIGNLVEQSHQLGPSIFKRIYFYNEVGQLFLEQRDDPATWLEYFYDADGKPTVVKDSWADGTPRVKRTMRCDDKGRVIEESVYDARGELETKIMRTYDDHGRVASEAYGDEPNEEYYSKTVYEHDDRGNIIEEKDYEKKELTAKTTYTYEFDGIGNWIKRTAITSNDTGDSSYETHRIITYNNRLLLNLLLNEYTQNQKKKF